MNLATLSSPILTLSLGILGKECPSPQSIWSHHPRAPIENLKKKLGTLPPSIGIALIPIRLKLAFNNKLQSLFGDFCECMPNRAGAVR